MVRHRKTIVITTGGTGGHMFPAASCAEALLKKGHRVVLITDKRGSEYKGVFAKHPMYKIKASSPRGSIFKLITGVINLGIGFFQAFFALGKVRPHIIVAFGGYASAPTVVAGMFRRIPVIVHEQNAILGKANRFTVKFAKKLALSYKETKLVPKSKKTVYVGMPVRPGIKLNEKSPYSELDENDEFKILVFGGSQGSKIFSLVVPAAISQLQEKFKKRISIVEQCRADEIGEVRKTYDKTGIKYSVGTFFDNMEDQIKQADLMICRAGSSTLAEATVIGRPMIMIPLKISQDGDQAANAKVVQEGGAGWVINEDNFNPSELKNVLEYLMSNPVFLKEAAHNAAMLGVVDADTKLADIVIKESKD